MKEILKKKFSLSNNPEWRERYEHSLAVAKVAVFLNEHLNLGLDSEKVYLTGILHDYAKFESFDNFKKISEKYDLDSKLLKESHKLYHAFFGPLFVKDELGIDDFEILNAIRYHTTGKENMSTLEELIFLADYIEENRIGEIYENVRKVAYTDLKKAVALELKQLVDYLSSQGKDIYIDTLNAYNYYKKYLEN